MLIDSGRRRIAARANRLRVGAVSRTTAMRHLTALGLGAGLAGASGLWLGDIGPANLSVTLSLGLFSAVLTALTIVLALTLDVRSRWPSLGDIAIESLLTLWFLVSLAAVVLATIAPSRTADPLIAVSLSLALWGAVLGTYALGQVLRMASGASRRLLSRLLQHRLSRAAWPQRLASGLIGGFSETLAEGVGAVLFGADPLHDRLTAFRDSVDDAIDKQDLPTLRDRVAELADAAEFGEVETAPSALNLELKILSDIVQAVLLGRLDSAEVGAALVPEITDHIVSHAGRLLWDAAGSDSGRRSEQIAATYLAQTSRLLAWAAMTSHASALRSSSVPAALRGAFSGAVAGRKMILLAADPDPRSTYLPADSPWRHGFRSPAAGMLWWWSYAELNGPGDGNAIYAMAEILTGEKFYGSFGWGNRYVRTEARDTGADLGVAQPHAGRWIGTAVPDGMQFTGGPRPHRRRDLAVCARAPLRLLRPSRRRRVGRVAANLSRRDGRRRSRDDRSPVLLYGRGDRPLGDFQA